MSNDVSRTDLLKGADTPTDTGDEDEWYDPEYNGGEAIVRVTVGFSTRDGADAARMECIDDEWYFRSGAIECTVPESAISRLRSHAGIRYVERPKEPELDAYTWGAERIKAPVAHDVGHDGTGIDIAIVDSGIHSTHTALAANLGIGYVAPDVAACDETCPSDPVVCTETWDDDYGHGTAMASVAAAVLSDAVGEYSGVAHSATIHAARVIGCNPSGDGTVGSSTSVAQGIEWAAGQGHDVINMSLSFSASPDVVKDACEYAFNQGCVLVGSAGNNWGEAVRPPAAYSEVIGVSAIDENDQLADFSNEGSRVELCAPGEVLHSAADYVGNEWKATAGTSPAAAFVSGAATLVVGDGYAGRDARIQLRDTAEDIGLSSDQQGQGLVDAQNALSAERVEVTTNEATGVSDTSATLHGELTALEQADSANVNFEWGRVGAGFPNTTAVQRLSSTTTFSQTITDLDRQTDYEFRAVAAGSSRTDRGVDRTFTTERGFGENADYHLVTDVNGGGTFAALPQGSYRVETGIDGYNITKDTLSHTSAGTSVWYLTPLGVDAPDDITAPATSPHFEVAILEQNTGANFHVPVLVSNVATDTGTTEVTLETAAGERIDQRTVSLDGFASQQVTLSARMAFRGTAGGVDVVVRTTNDEEHATLESEAIVEEVVGPGRPTTLGGSHARALGGTFGGTLGRERDQYHPFDPDLARVPNSYGLTLENAAGARRHVEDANNWSFRGAHTGLSSWSIEVPADPSLEEWARGFDTQAYITSDERLIAVGYATGVSTTTDGSRTTIEGNCSGKELDRGDEAFGTGGEMAVHRALQNAVDDLAPEWDWHVAPPTDRFTVGEKDVSGTPLQIFERLHTDFGYVFAIDPTKFRTAYSFPTGGVVRQKDFDNPDFERSQDYSQYYTAVKVEGGEDDEGDPYTGGYIDWPSVREIAAEQGISEDDAIRVYPVRDPSIESDKEASARARGVYSNIVEDKEVSGSIDGLADMLIPGLAYPMPWDEGSETGIHSLEFQSGGGVRLPGETMAPMARSGAISMWVKAEWSDLDPDEVRLFGSQRSGRSWQGIRTTGRGGVEFFAHNVLDSQIRINASDGYPPDDEWTLFHFDWDYDPSIGTTYRAGNGGEIVETATMAAAPQIPRGSSDTLWFGRMFNHHFRGFIDSAEFWDAPQETYPPANDSGLVARYPFDEGPREESMAIFDHVRRKHGRRNDRTRWAGTPQTLQGETIDDNDGSYSFEKTADVKHTVEDLYRRIDRLEG